MLNIIREEKDSMLTETVRYKDDNVSLEGFVAYNNSHQEKRPLVLVAHDWTGRNEFACNKAKALADLGYVGFAIDMYGDAKLGQDTDEKRALMQPLMSNRQLLQHRINAALNVMSSHPCVDQEKIAAIGFCFGGLCVLDLARSGANVKGVVSFHGLLFPPENLPVKSIKSKVLVLHGFDDPMVERDQVWNFADEMKKQEVDWQIHMYSNTLHAFTNPLANDPGFGTVYNKTADHRSWITMKNFLEEIF